MNSIRRKTNKLKENQENSTFQKQLNEASISLINAHQYQMVRLVLLILLAINYLFIPLFQHNFNSNNLILIALSVLLTEPAFKYSFINYLVNTLKVRKQQQKAIEVFFLFDILKTDLYSQHSKQQINIYSLLHDSIDHFQHIKPSIIKMLNVWKTSPQKAKHVMYEDIGGDSTRELGELIFKLDQMNRADAQKLIKSKQGVFSQKYFEQINRHIQSAKTKYYAGFFIVNMICIGWLITYFVVSLQDALLIN